MRLQKWIDRLMGRGHSSKRVALALGGGGARGLAHIGAIEELLRRGYIIHSVAGTSMGAIVGGFYACGQLEDLKQTFDQLSRRDIMSLINFSLGLDHVASGDKLEELMEDMLQGARIEDLPISYRCCASDLVSGHERVFTHGPLAHAIRASISIPGFFSPWASMAEPTSTAAYTTSSHSTAWSERGATCLWESTRAHPTRSRTPTT